MELKLEPLSQPVPLSAAKQATTTATGTTCPKCKYQRRTADTVPAWQCPGCGVAYAKVAPAPQDKTAATAGGQRRARVEEDDDAPVVAERSPMDTMRIVVGVLVLVMVVGAGWSWVAKRNSKKLQAEQAVAAERQQAIDQAAGNLATDARLAEAADKLRSGRTSEAFAMLKPLADQGDARAMLMVGMMLYSGYGECPKTPSKRSSGCKSRPTAGTPWPGFG